MSGRATSGWIRPTEVLARVKVIGMPAEGSPESLKVEAVLNGYPHSFQQVPQDGSVNDLVFKVPVARSSWLAFRVFPVAHTNPIFLSVGGRPIRASRQSAEWCLRGVDQCWHEKARFYHRTRSAPPSRPTSTPERSIGACETRAPQSEPYGELGQTSAIRLTQQRVLQIEALTTKRGT